MRVKIDKAPSHHEAGSVDGVAAGQFLLADGGDRAVGNPDIAYGIEPGLGVHDTPALDDQVEFGSGGLSASGQADRAKQ